MRRIGKFRAPGIACALLLAVTGGVLLAGGGATAARADTVFSLPASVTYLTQTLPDTLGGNGYVFISANGEIMVYDLTGQQVTAFDANDGIGGLALSPDGATLYASVAAGANADSVAAITVSSIASGPVQQTFYPLAAGDEPGSLAVQSGKVWVGYKVTTAVDPTAAIGAMDLPGDGTFEAAAAPGAWTTPVQLAADPGNSGMLVAVDDPQGSSALAATYNTTTDPATPLAAQGALGTGGNVCTYLGELAVVPGGQRFAAGCDGPASVQEYGTADVADVNSYNANGGGDSQAIAVAVDTDGTFAVANRHTVYVYKPDGTLLNTFAITAGNKTDEAYGLAWADTAGGSSLVAVSQFYSADPTVLRPYTVQILAKAKLLRPAVTFTATAKVSFGKPVKLTGTALLPGGGADTAKVTITRTGPGGTVSLPAVTPSGAGAFTATDTPKAVGSYTYTAKSGATSVTAKATVVKDTPALTLTPASSTVGYQSVVQLTATLGATHGNRVLTIYAQVSGGKNKVIATGKVNSKGQLSVAWTALQSSAFLAKFAGDTGDAAVSASATATVRAQVTEALSGQYGTKKSGGTTYRLYHRSGKLTIAATVTPSHPGECVKAELQLFTNGAWHASTTTACAKLGAASEATMSLTFGKAQLGIPYRIRADYVSSSKRNASGKSAWQYLMVEK